ncbi:TetR/AcrR family transcriptional regulator C-terminal ligand-binding domain-containing protein [Pandoraea terrae]|nr:TetR/AcrR family transcriptional regulator C-terminal ligand-binding domain-containing protein [Pandoraea terrae]
MSAIHMSVKNGPGQVRPGGRTEEVRKAVATTVLGLIEKGRVDFELQEVARLSNVHRTTIHRRWPDRTALIAEALSEHNSRIDVQFSGDWRIDIARMALALRDFLNDPVEIAMNTLLASANNAEFREMVVAHWAPVMTYFQRPILEAQARGEIDPKHDAEMLVTMMIAPIVTVIIFLKQRPDDQFIERLAMQLINACT